MIGMDCSSSSSMSQLEIGEDWVVGGTRKNGTDEMGDTEI